MTASQADTSSPPPEGTEVLTTAEVAALYGVGAKTVARWAQQGRLPEDFRTLGGHRRWYADSVPATRRGAQQ